MVAINKQPPRRTVPQWSEGTKGQKAKTQSTVKVVYEGEAKRPEPEHFRKAREERGHYKIRRKKEAEARRQEQYLQHLEEVEGALPTNLKFSEEELIASICKESFYEFVKEFLQHVWAEKPVWNWHIEFLCHELQVMAERVFKGEVRPYDLVVNIPPGTTKSTICSVMFPIWCWLRMPTARFICASYSYPLAMDLSRKSRDIVTSDKFRTCFPDIELRSDQNTKGYFANTAGGYRYAVGTGGSVLGFHAHFIIIDDPLDPKQAASELDLKAANDWLEQTIPSRKVDRGVSVTVVVMQRLHQDDPTAVFLRRKKIRHICLPAEITDDVAPETLRKKYVNGLLDPVRLNRDRLREAEEENGQYGYAGQYLQNPTPAGGGMFKVERLKTGFTRPTHFPGGIVRCWDKAGTHKGGAWTVGVLMGKDEQDRIWILDVIRFQLDTFDREQEIAKAAKADGHKVIVVIEQEGGSGGKGDSESTARMLSHRGYRVRINKVTKSDGDKIKRADPFSVQVNAGNVYLAHPVDSTWWKDYIAELKHFPMSKYKDQVDASAGAFTHLWKRKIRIGGVRSRQPVED
jgi:predicted phage terminase large subunit-like protein